MGLYSKPVLLTVGLSIFCLTSHGEYACHIRETVRKTGEGLTHTYKTIQTKSEADCQKYIDRKNLISNTKLNILNDSDQKPLNCKIRVKSFQKNGKPIISEKLVSAHSDEECKKKSDEAALSLDSTNNVVFQSKTSSDSNCKLTIRIQKTDGSSEVKTEQVFAESERECERLAHQRKLATDSSSGKIETVYSWQ